MSKSTEKNIAKYLYTQNRELSWLRFNYRVLEEAADETVPLLERLKFISIFSSNLDEFFMVRIGSLFDLSLVSPEEIDNKTGMTPIQQLKKIYQMIPKLLKKKDVLFREVSAQLEKAGICDLSEKILTDEESRYISNYFKGRILPVLSPQIVDSHHPFPNLVSKSLYIAAMVRDNKGHICLGLIPVPASAPSYVEIPGKKGKFVRTEHMIRDRIDELFGAFRVEDYCILSVTRNADISFDEEKFDDFDGEDFRSHMSKLLKKRRYQSIIRLELSNNVRDDFLKLLKKRIRVENYQIFISRAPLNMKYVFGLEELLSKEQKTELCYVPFQSRWPEDLDPRRSMIQQIQEEDRLLFFPFDQVAPFLGLLKEAAEDSDVLSIKITIYRLSSTSKIAHVLCRAAENGKEVTVLMELRARFDEENNINWSKVLEDSGCQVIYGVEGYKCHSKICLITMKKKDSLCYITQIGTGNYNENTNKAYTDLSILTADPEIGLDGTVFFQNMLLGNTVGIYRRLLTAPAGIRPKLMELIEKEIEKGENGYIFIKVNAMTERHIIDKLAEASQAGVRIDLVVRGICCLLPGIQGYTENIQVTSIVGRYLEHARIYWFGKGETAQIFISSADLMTRNLNRRVEIACPIQNAQLRKKIQRIVEVELNDNVKASAMLSDGSYRRKTDGNPPAESQIIFMEKSLHSQRKTVEITTKMKSSPSRCNIALRRIFYRKK